MLRRVLFWAHLSVGVAAGLIILVMCVTGVGLAFERQINRLADRAGRTQITPGAARLPVDRLLNALPEGSRDLSAITLHADPSEPVDFSFGRERTWFVDPYTGRALGRSSQSSRLLFAWLERWHRTLGSQLRGHGPGRAVTGAANLVFLFLVASGPLLWLPRKFVRQRFRAILFWRRGGPLRASLWNLHHVAGIWSAVPLFFIVLSGVVMSYPWANDLLYRAAGSVPPPRIANGPQTHAPGNRTQLKSVDWDGLFRRAESQLPGWQTVSLRWPPSAEAVFTIDRGNGGQPRKRAQLTLDTASGSIRKWEPFSAYTKGRQWRARARFLHTGELAGWFGQTVALLASAGGALLVVSGLWLTWLRIARRRKTTALASEAVPNVAELVEK